MKQRRRKNLGVILTAGVGTLAITVLVLNLSSRERKGDHRIPSSMLDQ